MNSQALTPNQLTHLATKVTRINRLIDLKKHGFTEQNHFARYQQKLKNNKPAQTLRNAKALAASARKLSLYVDRCVGLA